MKSYSFFVLALFLLTGCTLLANPTPPAATPLQPLILPTFDAGYPDPAALAPAPTRITQNPYPSRSDEANPVDAHVRFVKAIQEADGTWTFEVTIEHPDKSPEDYADGWDIITPEGVVIKAKIEDPFTYPIAMAHVSSKTSVTTQTGIIFPADVTQIFVRAHDKKMGWGGQMVFVDLTLTEGLNYVVEKR